MDTYVLDGHTPVKELDLTKWGKWHQTADRVVEKTTVGDIHISTVFLAIDHSFGGGPPLLFETMVFGGDLDQAMERCRTWDKAVDQHQKMVEAVNAARGTGND